MFCSYFASCTATLQEGAERGFTRSDLTREKSAIESGRTGHYWHWKPNKADDAHETDDVDDEIADGNAAGGDSRPVVDDPLHYCPVCGASYITYGRFNNHMTFGTHKVKPEKITMRDQMLGMFNKEEFQCQTTLFCNKDCHEGDVVNGREKREKR